MSKLVLHVYSLDWLPLPMRLAFLLLLIVSITLYCAYVERSEEKDARDR